MSKCSRILRYQWMESKGEDDSRHPISRDKFDPDISIMT